MVLKGINAVCMNSTMMDALKKSGYKVYVKKTSWPRLKGPKGVRIDCSTGMVVSSVR